MFGILYNVAFIVKTLGVVFLQLFSRLINLWSVLYVFSYFLSTKTKSSLEFLLRELSVDCYSYVLPYTKLPRIIIG